MRLALLALLCGCWTSSTPIVENPIERRFVKKQRATCAKLETHAGLVPKAPDLDRECGHHVEDVDRYLCSWNELSYYAGNLKWWIARADDLCAARTTTDP